MPPSTSVAFEPPPGLDEVHVTYEPRSRASSGRSASIRSHPTSRGSGSGSSDRHSISGSEGSWKLIDRHHFEEDDEEEEEDDLRPSDSASRAREPLSRRYTAETRPAPTRRHSSRRVRQPAPEAPPPEPEVDEPRRQHSSRRHRTSHRPRRHDSHRAPSDESSLDTVASHDDYPYSHHGMPPPRAYPPPGSYRHGPPQSHGGYPPSVAPSAPPYADGYGGRQLVHMPQQDPFGYPINNNPFTPPDAQSNPFSPMSAASGGSYFNMDPHAPPMPHQHRPSGPPRPQSYMAPSSHYGSEMMSPYGHPGMPQYPGYGMPPMPGYPMPGWFPPSSHTSSPAPKDEKEKEDKAEKKSKEQLEAIQAVLAKTEESRLAWHKEILAKAEADAAELAAKKAKEEEEKKKKEEIADATKKAREAAEKKAEEASKKAKDEHEKKLKEAEEAREEAVKKQKELEAETAKLKPPDHAGKQIKFKDALGRKFSFPFHLCKNWKGMEGLIKQAFLQIEGLGDLVRQGQYDLTGPDGEIILPQVWETMVQPDWEIEMHMWPQPEEETKKKKAKHNDGWGDIADPFASLGLGDLGIVDPMGKMPKKNKKDGVGKKSGKSRAADANVIEVGPSGGIPPPPNFPPGMLPDPLSMAFPGVEMMPKEKAKRSKSSSGRRPASNAFTSWMVGGAKRK